MITGLNGSWAEALRDAFADPCIDIHKDHLCTTEETFDVHNLCQSIDKDDEENE